MRNARLAASLRQVTAICAILALTAFQVALFSSLHLHVLTDGRVTVHSHAVPDTRSGESHQHSAKELPFLQALNRLLDKTLTFEAAIAAEPQRVVLPIHSSETSQSLTAGASDISGRSPPLPTC